SPTHHQALLLDKRFEVLLGTLLGAKADEIVHRRATGGQLASAAVVRFGLSNPLPGQLFHRELCPSTRPPAETSRLPPDARQGSWACGRGGPTGTGSPRRGECAGPDRAHCVSA